MTSLNRKIQGAMMLALAAVCFWLPHKLQEPGIADHRIILAQDVSLQSGTFFDRTVIYIAHHDGLSAMGLVLNLPGATPDDISTGGPVEPEKLFVLYKAETGLNVMEATNEQALRAFVADLKKDSRDYVVLRGYAGWGIGQLDREIDQGRWKVVLRDDNIIFKSKPKDMWTQGQQKPAAN